MSIHNEEDFKIEQNKKKYSIILSIQEDQLFMGLTLLSNPPKKYSSYFSLNELRISSKIFDHTKTLFEAKEIIKRTVIRKQLLIDEDEHRARITFDTGLGHDSVPFPIILFRDSNIHKNNQNLENPKDNNRKTKLNKNKNTKNNDDDDDGGNESNKKKRNDLNNQVEEEKSQNTSNNTYLNLRASIGNNINNKMLNNNENKVDQINKTTIKTKELNIQFNNSIKKTIPSKKSKKSNNRLNENINNRTKSKKTKEDNINNHTNTEYNKVDFVNNGNNLNNTTGNVTKDYITYNNNLLYNIYNNMNNANNVNSSFYRNLQYSFGQNNLYDNMTVHTDFNNNIIFDNIPNIPITRLNIRNIDNNSINQTNLQQQNTNIQNMQNMQKNAVLKNINNNTNNNPNINNNNNRKINPNTYININKQIQNNLEYIKKIPNPKKSNNLSNNSSFFAQNKSSHIRRNLTLQNIDNNKDTDSKNKTNIEINKNSISGKDNNDDDINSFTSSISETNDKIDENIEEFNIGDQPYRFKNLIIQGSKKIKGNLEKFKENQNMGDYIPAGSKFVSYLKFPDTKRINSNLSMTASTISSSLTSGSNRIVGIEKNIIKNPGELEEITARIQRIVNKRNIKYKLLYKASTDGDICTTFHTKCDKIPNTLVLIQAAGDKRFGGFTTQTWDGDDVNKEDKNCFIFSIDNMKVYDVNKGEEAINCNPDLGPVFINQIKLLDKFFTQGGSTNKKGMTFGTKEDFEINGGAEKFGVKDVEVYYVK